ncbi:thioredoxin domain-containing protein 3 isoform X1 [Pezoporus wallicus]|uniref:thioredoxin domain-containing protein 3 isoform X1 n=1 Tax=Pezoporus wallicus TaxID=35540 RepID=UPI00254D2644|nr:thioredoxin domain-containing protein 3 isoform X1 [Pezoporus wallicus]
MAGKKKEIQLQMQITNENQWGEMLLMKGVVVIDVYQAWCGPCKAVLSLFRKLKSEFSEDDVLHFAVAEADSILALQSFRNKCEPVFLFCVNGKIISIVKGVNAPLLSKKITELVLEERAIASGQKEHTTVEELVLHEEKPPEEPVEETAPQEKAVKYSLGIIKPDDVSEGRVEEIKSQITNAGFSIEAEEEKMLTEEQIRVFYACRAKECLSQGRTGTKQVNRQEEKASPVKFIFPALSYIRTPDFEDFLQFMLSGPCHILIVSKKNPTDAIPHWKELDEMSKSVDEAEKPDRGEETVETGALLNVCDMEDSIENASRQLAFFFPNFDTHKTEQRTEKTLALIRPCLLKERRESILQRIKDDGFKIAMQKEITLTEEQIHEFYKEHVDQDYFPVLLEQMTSGPTLVLALTRENAVARWRELLGPKSVEQAMKENPNSLRAQYAVSNVPIGQLHGSSTPDDAQKELEFFFPQEHTLALIKPAAAAKHKDDILQKVKGAGFTISKIKEESLTREVAAQFYQDHKGKPFFEDLLSCMTEGPSVIMVLTKENAVEEWRHIMGPVDPEVAKETSPGSIRAHFAQDILSNAVHGSSTKEHAQKSIECVFGELDLN